MTGNIEVGTLRYLGYGGHQGERAGRWSSRDDEAVRTAASNSHVEVMQAP